MQHSETISKLAAALCKAQSVMPTASKNAKAVYGSYTTLTELWDTCRPVLAEHKLAVVQTFSGDQGLAVDTTVIHESGEWISGTIRMPVEKATAQGVGSAVTYARRYGLAAILGMVSDVDDNGNEASKPEPKPTTARRSTPKPGKNAGQEIADKLQAAIETWIPHDPEDYPGIKEKIKAAYGLPQKPTMADVEGLLGWIETNIENKVTYIAAIKETK